MKHIAFALLMLTCSAFGQDWTVARCRKTFEDRQKQLAVHLDGMTSSRTERFKSSVEMTPTRTLIRWQQEVEICTKTDGERPLYGSVSRQLNEVLDEPSQLMFERRDEECFLSASGKGKSDESRGMPISCRPDVKPMLRACI